MMESWRCTNLHSCRICVCRRSAHVKCSAKPGSKNRYEISVWVYPYSSWMCPVQKIWMCGDPSQLPAPTHTCKRRSPPNSAKRKYTELRIEGSQLLEKLIGASRIVEKRAVKILIFTRSKVKKSYLSWRRSNKTAQTINNGCLSVDTYSSDTSVASLGDTRGIRQS